MPSSKPGFATLPSFVCCCRLHRGDRLWVSIRLSANQASKAVDSDGATQTQRLRSRRSHGEAQSYGKTHCEEVEGCDVFSLVAPQSGSMCRGRDTVKRRARLRVLKKPEHFVVPRSSKLKNFDQAQGKNQTTIIRAISAQLTNDHENTNGILERRDNSSEAGVLLQVLPDLIRRLGRRKTRLAAIGWKKALPASTAKSEAYSRCTGRCINEYCSICDGCDVMNKQGAST